MMWMGLANRLSGLSLSTRLTAVMVALVVITAAAVVIPASNILEGRGACRARSSASKRMPSCLRTRSSAVTAWRVPTCSPRARPPRSMASCAPTPTTASIRWMGPRGGVAQPAWRPGLPPSSRIKSVIRNSASSASPTTAARSCASTARVRDGAVRIVPEHELRRKGDADYFKTAIGLPDGEVGISRLDLNREDGKIEMPNVPVLAGIDASLWPRRCGVRHRRDQCRHAPGFRPHPARRQRRRHSCRERSRRLPHASRPRARIRVRAWRAGAHPGRLCRARQRAWRRRRQPAFVRSSPRHGQISRRHRAGAMAAGPVDRCRRDGELRHHHVGHPRGPRGYAVGGGGGAARRHRFGGAGIALARRGRWSR